METDMPTEAAPAQAAGIMYMAAGRVLLMKRQAASVYGGHWAFPAGTVEPGETTIETAIRESREETGHAPEGGLSLVGEDAGFTLFLCTDAQFSPILNHEHDGYVWASPDDLPSPLHPGVAQHLQTVAMDESARFVDTNGWCEIKGNPLSKVGIFEYRGSQLMGAPDPNAIYRVYRSAEELSSPECLASFRLLPWIDNHVMLGSEDNGLMPAERKGVQGVIGEDVHFDAPYLRGNLKVFSQSLAGLIEAGKRELSAGYRCKYDWTPGTFAGEPYDCVQRDLRGNHLALVQNGRMGPDVSVLDSADLDQESQSENAKEPQMADEAKKEDGGSGMTLEQAVEVIKQAMPAITMMQEMAAAAAGKTDAVVEAAKVDDPIVLDEGKKAPVETAAEAKKDEGKAMDAKPALTFKEMLAMAARRDALATQVSAHVGTFDHSAMDEAEVVTYGVTKLGIKAPQGQEAAVLAGYLQAAVAPGRQKMAGVAMDASVGDNFVKRQLASAADKE